MGPVADFDPSVGVSPRGRGKGGGVAMLFGVPGQAANTEVSHEEWQADYERHGPWQKIDSSPPKSSAPPSHQDLRQGSDSTQALAPKVEGVMMAWDNSSSECGSDGMERDSSQLGIENDGSYQGIEKNKHSKGRDTIKNEWYVVPSFLHNLKELNGVWSVECVWFDCTGVLLVRRQLV